MTSNFAVCIVFSTDEHVDNHLLPFEIEIHVSINCSFIMLFWRIIIALFQWNSFQNSFQNVFHFCELRSFGIPCFACILDIPSYRNFSIVFEVVLNSMELQLTEEEYIKTGHLVRDVCV